MTYPEAIQYLESFVNYERLPDWPYQESLKLDRFEYFLRSIGDPQEGLRFVHIAGSKGKGSTCAFIAYILQAAGYKTGLYTSPHLVDFRERIRILRPKTESRGKAGDFEGRISRRDLKELVIRLRPRIERFNADSKYGPLSFFEVYTALSFVYFREKKCSLIVLETGMGGRLDATNVVKPLVCAITPVSYEHTDKLGNTLPKIAAEKAGIIKPGTIVISAPQEKSALRVIRSRCRETGARLYTVNKDITYSFKNGVLTIKGMRAEYKGLRPALYGGYQFINAGVAVAVIEALRGYGIEVSAAQIKKGIRNTRWPGRCEILSRRPLVVLDGAQNTASVLALKRAIRDNFKYRRLIIVLGISQDKDIKGICRELYGTANKLILTRANTPRACGLQEMAKHFPGKEIYLTENIKKAKALALRIAGKDDLVLVCGSLFIVGEFRNDRVRP